MKVNIQQDEFTCFLSDKIKISFIILKLKHHSKILIVQNLQSSHMFRFQLSHVDLLS